jgi:hypothetical protein
MVCLALPSWSRPRYQKDWAIDASRLPSTIKSTPRVRQRWRISPPPPFLTKIPPVFSCPSLSLYLSCPLLNLDSNGKALTSCSPATLHFPRSNQLHHTKNIHSQPRHRHSRRRRMTTLSRARHPIAMCLWIACGRAYGKQRNDRWQLNLPRSSPLNVTVGRQHHHNCKLGHLNLTNRTSSQRNCKKENLSELIFPVPPPIPVSVPPYPYFPPPSPCQPYRPQSPPSYTRTVILIGVFFLTLA